MAKRYQALPIVIDPAQTAELKHPSWLMVYDAATRAEWFGARQAWFREKYRQARGCGVVTAALATAYAAHKPMHVSLYQPYQEAARAKGSIPGDYVFERAAFLGHMIDLWRYATPSPWGLLPKKFRNGISRFARERGISLSTEIMKVGLFNKRNRRNFKRLLRFLLDGFNGDMPVAMVLYSRGQIKEVKELHWVTIVGIAANNDLTQAVVRVSDHGREKTFSLDEWFYSTRIGGAFITYHLEGVEH